MWAQLITTRLKDGSDDRLDELKQEIQGAEQEGSGLIRSMFMRDQSDPNSLFMLVVFESEEAARARENDPRRAERLGSARAIMAEIFDGPPSFTDLIVSDEFTP